MAQLLDYHVGLLRGFLIATNAHQTIQHALEVVLENYHEKAGPLIGRAENKPDVIAPKFETTVQKIEKEAEKIVIERPDARAFVRWQPLEMELINELHGAGKTVAEIRDALNARFNTERKYPAVYAKMTAMGLT